MCSLKVDLPTISLPRNPTTRGSVKALLEAAMEVPAIGHLLRQVAAAQTLFPNFRVDQLSYFITRQVLKSDSCCIDIGAHRGEILKHFLDVSHQGRHWAFEPMPRYGLILKERFGSHSNVTLCEQAVSDSAGTANFSVVRSFPGFSGLQTRAYQGGDPDIESISVKVVTLDSVIPAEQRIDLIKLDIEGAELLALRGATRILQGSHPHILLEFQQKGAPYFGYGPNELFAFLSEYGYKLWTLHGWLENERPLSLSALHDAFENDPDLYLFCEARR
jgi:FkbM family methyltransferase